MSDLPYDYDNWRTRAPGDGPYDEHEPVCDACGFKPVEAPSELCGECFEREAQAKEFAYVRHVPRYLVADDAEARDEYEREMRDAGRGHLLRQEY